MNVFSRIIPDDFEQIEFINHNASGLRAILAIHNTTRGPAFGGIRFLDYPTENDAFIDVIKLARAMTLKAAMADLNGGGGKIVIINNKNFNRKQAFKMLGRFVESLKGRFYAGRDVGTTIDDMEIMRAETKYVVSETYEGAGNLAAATAVGVYEGIKASIQYVYGDPILEGKVIAIQGLGNVGVRLTQYLNSENAIVIGNDINQEIAEKARKSTNIKIVSGEEIIATPCDVFSPCALGGIISKNNIDKINCKIIAGSANNQLQDFSLAIELKNRNILYAPDYIINAGALIQGANWFLKGDIDSFEHIRKIAETLRFIYTQAESQNKSTLEIANEIALSKIKYNKSPEDFFIPK